MFYDGLPYCWTDKSCHSQKLVPHTHEITLANYLTLKFQWEGKIFFFFSNFSHKKYDPDRSSYYILKCIIWVVVRRSNPRRYRERIRRGRRWLAVPSWNPLCGAVCLERSHAITTAVNHNHYRRVSQSLKSHMTIRMNQCSRHSAVTSNSLQCYYVCAKSAYCSAFWPPAGA